MLSTYFSHQTIFLPAEIALLGGFSLILRWQAIHGKDRTRMIIYLVHMLLEHTQGFISCDARLHIS